MHAVFEGVIERICRELAGLDSDATQTCSMQSGRGRSIQAGVEDLVHNYRVTRCLLEHRLGKDRLSRNQKRSQLQWVLQLMVLSFGYIPQGSEFPNQESSLPERFSPMNGNELYRMLRQELEDLDSLLDKCRRRFGMERVATHFLLGPLRVDQWRRFHVVHSLYCLRQLRMAQPFASKALSSSMGNLTLGKKLDIPTQRSLT